MISFCHKCDIFIFFLAKAILRKEIITFFHHKLTCSQTSPTLNIRLKIHFKSKINGPPGTDRSEIFKMLLVLVWSEIWKIFSVLVPSRFWHFSWSWSGRVRGFKFLMVLVTNLQWILYIYYEFTINIASLLWIHYEYHEFSGPARPGTVNSLSFRDKTVKFSENFHNGQAGRNKNEFRLRWGIGINIPPWNYLIILNLIILDASRQNPICVTDLPSAWGPEHKVKLMFQKPDMTGSVIVHV